MTDRTGLLTDRYELTMLDSWVRDGSAGHGAVFEVFGVSLEPAFLDRLERAPSNIPDLGNGRRIYEKFVRPAAMDSSTVRSPSGSIATAGLASTLPTGGGSSMTTSPASASTLERSGSRRRPDTPG